MPDSEDKLVEYYRAVIKQYNDEKKLPLFIGGKALGALIASLVASDYEKLAQKIEGVISLGYPFHPKGLIKECRFDHFAPMLAPHLIV